MLLHAALPFLTLFPSPGELFSPSPGNFCKRQLRGRLQKTFHILLLQMGWCSVPSPDPCILLCLDIYHTVGISAFLLRIRIGGRWVSVIKRFSDRVQISPGDC